MKITSFLRPVTFMSVSVCSALFAEEVVINPGAGVEYVQSEAATGDVDLRVKSGLVTLHAANSHTGTTYVPNALIALTADAVPGEASPVGTQGPVILTGPATIRSVGDEPILWTMPFTNDYYNAAYDTNGANKGYHSGAGLITFDTQADLTIGALMRWRMGGLVKYGPGTLRLATPADSTHMISLNNSKAPTRKESKDAFALENGLAKDFTAEAFAILQGKVVVEDQTLGGKPAQYTVGSSKGRFYLGGWTAGEGVQEASPELEVKGTLTVNSEFNTPWNNGFKDFNTPDGPTTPTIRVRNGGKISLASSKTGVIGLNDVSGKRANCSPRLIVEAGGTFSHGGAVSYGFFWPYHGGHQCEAQINGTMTVPTLTAAYATSTDVQRCDPSDTWLKLDVGAGGSFTCKGFRPTSDTDDSAAQFFTVHDGGIFTLGYVTNVLATANYAFAVTNGGILVVSGAHAPSCKVQPIRAEMLFDGGILRAASNKLVLFQPYQKVLVGRNGLKANLFTGSTSTVYANVPFEHDPACAGADGGVELATGKTGAALVLTAASTYTGPTKLTKGILAFSDEGALPAASELILNGGSLVLTNAAERAFGRVTVAAGTTSAITLRQGQSFAVTNAFACGDGATLAFTLVDADGQAVSDVASYDVLRVPAADAAALAAVKTVSVAGRAVCGRTVVTDGETAVLRVALVPTLAGTWTNPAGGDWSAAANWSGETALPPWGEATFGTSAQAGGATVNVAGAQASSLKFASGVGGYSLAGGHFELKPFNGSEPAEILVNAADGVVFGAPGETEENSIDFEIGGLEVDHGEVVFNSGRMHLSANLSLCATWKGDSSSSQAKKDAARLLTPSFTMNGGSVVVEGVITPRMNPLYGPSTFTMNGGTLTGFGDFRVARSAGFTDGEETTNRFNAGTLVVSNTVCLAYGRQIHSHSRFGEGFTCKFGADFHGSASMTTGEVVFDGGCLMPLGTANPAANVNIRQIADFRIAAGGLVIDMGEFAGDPDVMVKVENAFRPDPALGAALDGGITVCGGRGACAFTHPCQTNRLAGGFRVTDGACVVFSGGTNENDVVYGSGTTWRIDNTAPSAECGLYGRSVALGEADGTAPVRLIAGSSYLDTGKIVCCVRDRLTVLSPVEVCTAVDPDDIRGGDVVKGTVRLFAYDKTQGAVDLSLFRLADKRFFAGTFTEEEVQLADGRTYAVVTLSVARDPSGGATGKWIATTAGGDWSEDANWTGRPPSAAGEIACFNPAAAEDVAVNVDRPTTVGAISFAGGADNGGGYVISGAALTLRDDAETPAVVNLSGTNTVSAPLALPGGVLEACAAVNAKLSLTSLAGVTATIDANGTTPDFAEKAGDVELGLTGFAGSVRTALGRTTVDDLSFAGSDVAATTLGGGTFRYTGASCACAGFTLASDGAHASVFDVANGDATVTLRRLQAETGTSAAFLKTGPGAVRFAGTETTELTFYRDAGSGRTTTVAANGDGPTGAYRSFNVDEGTVTIGTLDDPNDAPTLTFNCLVVGRKHPRNASVARLFLNNGTLETSSATSLHYYPVTTSNVRTPPDELVVNGGLLKVKTVLRCGYNGSFGSYRRGYVFEQNGGRVEVGTSFYARYSATTESAHRRECRFNGGTTTVGGKFFLGFDVQPDAHDDSTGNIPTPVDVYVNGGTVEVAGECILSTNAPAMTPERFPTQSAKCHASLHLDAGVFKAMNITAYAYQGGTDNTRVFFNGGTYAPSAAGSLGGFAVADTLRVSTNGAVITTAEIAEGVYAVTDPLVHDPALGENRDGGLVKGGEGTLVLAAANTYTGPTVVTGGTLRVTSAGRTSADVVLADGTVVYEGGAALASVAGAGTLSGAVSVRRLCPASAGSLALDGANLADGRLEVDLEKFSGLKLGDRVVLADVANVTVPTRCRILNAGPQVRSGELAVEDGKLVVTLINHGVVLVVR